MKVSKAEALINHLSLLSKAIEGVRLVRGGEPLTGSLEEEVNLAGLKARGKGATLSIIPDLKGGARLALMEGANKIARALVKPATIRGLEKGLVRSEETVARTLAKLLTQLSPQKA